jgi:hypothetical protein
MLNTAKVAIRKDTQAFRDAIALAKTVPVTCFSLSNYFRGSPTKCGIPAYDLEGARTKLEREGNKFVLKVHGNLWYEWEAKPFE